MIKTDNLYAEVVINESPFYYDDHGRLRARVLNEEQSLNELSMRGPEAAPTVQKIGLAPMPKPKQDDEEAKLRAEFEKEDEGMMYNARAYENPADHPKERKYAQWKQDRKNKQGALTPMPEKKPGVPVEKTDMPEPPVRGGVPAKQKPGLGKIIGGIKRPGIGGIARPMPALPPSGRATVDQGFAPGEERGRGVARPAVEPKRPGKPLRSFRFSSQSRAGAGRNVNTRAGLRGASGGMRAYALEEGALPATEYLEIYEESMVQDQKPMEPTTVAAAPEKAVEKKPMEKKPMEKKALSPEEQAARKAKTEKSLADWRAKNPEKAAENLQKAKEKTEKLVSDLKNLKKTDPEAYKARIDKARETMKAKNPEKFAAKEAKKAEFANKMKGLKDKIQKNRDLRAAKKSSKPSAGGMVKAATALQEKMDLQKAEMGEVIKDFQKSDAPQFKGKSKAKTAPVTAVNDTAKVVFGAVSQAVHSASHNEPLAPQSANIETSNVHWSSMCL